MRIRVSKAILRKNNRRGRCTLRNAEFRKGVFCGISLQNKVYFAELKLRKMLLLVSYVQVRRTPQRGREKHSRGAQNIFTGSIWGENFRFFFKIVHSGILYFWPTAGPPNVVGPRVANPLTHPFDMPGYVT